MKLSAALPEHPKNGKNDDRWHYGQQQHQQQSTIIAIHGVPD
jgi:hypothetical protein